MIDETRAVKEDAKKDVAAWKDMMARQNEFLTHLCKHPIAKGRRTAHNIMLMTLNTTE